MVVEDEEWWWFDEEYDWSEALYYETLADHFQELHDTHVAWMISNVDCE